MRNLAILGLVLSLAGAVLDLASGTAMLRGSVMGTAASDRAVLAWAVVLYSLAALLVVSGILGASSAGMRRMRMVGALMLIYGFVMVAIGALMYGGYAPMMGDQLLSSSGMLAVGCLMVVNGALMARSGTPQM